MTILFADGFEDAAASEYAASGVTVSTTAGRRGTGALKPESWQTVRFNCAASSTLFAHFAIKVPSAPGSDAELMRFCFGGTTHIMLCYSPSGALVVKTPVAELGRSSAGVVSTNGWTSYECKVVIHDTTGSVEVRLNGSATPTLNLTNQDTRNGSDTQIDNLMPYNSLGSSDWWIDDVVIWDANGSVNNTWMGDLRVDSYMPNADGDTTTMTTSTGTSHYALVDEVPSSGSDYVESGTVGNKDLFQTTNMSHTPASIKAVVAVATLLKSDAGSRSGALVLKSGGTESDGSNIAPSTSSVKYSRVVETDPNGGGAWTKAAVDALQVGVKVTV